MIELGLQRISRLLEKTPLPWRAIHVAGTNGKGSICAYISGMLDVYNKSAWRTRTGHQPLKHAIFTSPHLIDRWDCITIDQRTVEFSTFSQVEQAVLTRNDDDGIKASEFELLTATAFEIFTREEVDISVIEVGMGGRLDATNIIGQPINGISTSWSAATFRPPPLVNAIAKIGLDHQGFLGDTIEEIAREKAGIIKPRVPLVYEKSNDRSVTEEFNACASTKNTKAFALTELGIPLARITFRDLVTALPLSEIPGGDGPHDLMETSDSHASQSHVKQNTSVALRATWSALQQLDRLPTTENDLSKQATAELSTLFKDMLQVPSRTVFPGRLQRLSIERLTGRKEDILLDGAHNAQSAQVLASEVERLREQARKDRKPETVTWVLAASDSKDVKEILGPLLAPGDSVFAVEFGPVDGMPWVKPMKTADILDAARAVQHKGLAQLTDCGKDVGAALRSACERSGEGLLVVAGSLYLVGDVLRLLRDYEA